MFFRFLRGPSLIAAVIASFEKLVVHIERGVLHTHDQMQAKVNQIAELESEVDALELHLVRGSRFAAKLRELVG